MSFWKKAGTVVAAPVVVPAKAARKGVEKVGEKLVWTILRRVIIAVGGGLTGAGLMSDDELQVAAAALVTVITTAYSVYKRHQDNKQAA